jgi:hypothetical protein
VGEADAQSDGLCLLISWTWLVIVVEVDWASFGGYDIGWVNDSDDVCHLTLITSFVFCWVG